MARKQIPNVFLDANVVIEAGKPPGGPLISRVADLVEARLIKVVTTDLTIAEVAKKHTENDFGALKDILKIHTQQMIRKYLQIDMPRLTKAELRAQILSDASDAVAKMFKRLGAATLSIDDVKPTAVFKTYTDGTGFFDVEGKKSQFPDAFIFERLKLLASPESPVVIVSKDADFAAPALLADNITLQTSIADLFSSLGLQVEAPEVPEFLAEHEDRLKALVEEELQDLTLFDTDGYDAEIEALAVRDVEIEDVVAFEATIVGGPMLVVGTAKMSVSVAYTHPDLDNAVYDSEEKTLMPFGDVTGKLKWRWRADSQLRFWSTTTRAVRR